MSMWELLVNGEVIDRISLETNKYEEAHTYFRLRKNLDSKSFNDLFIVKEHKNRTSSTPFKSISWWKDENMNLDIEKD